VDLLFSQGRPVEHVENNPMSEREKAGNERLWVNYHQEIPELLAATPGSMVSLEQVDFYALRRSIQPAHQRAQSFSYDNNYFIVT
jgi:hypothetical protein